MSRLPFEDGDVVGLKIMCLFITSGMDDGSINLMGMELVDTTAFTMVHKGGNSWAFQSLKTRKYLTVTPDGCVDCTAQVPLTCETFNLIGADPRHVLFENAGNQNYLKADVNTQGSTYIICKDRTVSEQQNYFEIERL